MKVESITGRVQRVIHRHDTFHVLRLAVEKEDGVDWGAGTVTARGNLYGLLQMNSGVTIRLIGTWRKHPKYGEQFAIQSWRPWANRVEDVVLFLYTCIEGFITSRAVAVEVSQLGAQTFQVLSEGYEAVADRLGLDPRSDNLQRAVLGWQRAVTLRDLSRLLGAGGLASVDIQIAMSRFGTEAASIIQENPYRLMEVLPDFPKVDRLAMKLGLSLDDPRRLQGAILWALREEASQGHLFLPRNSIQKSLGRLTSRSIVLALPNISVDEAVEQLVQQQCIVLESGVGIYLPKYHKYERESAKFLVDMLAPSEMNVDLKPFLDEYEKNNKIRLSESQRAAVTSLAEHRVLVLTGLPGTGKTMTIRALVRLFDEAQVTVSLMAPTGIAAKRLASVTGRDASTVHRALGYDGNRWRFHENNRYIVDAVVVDEISMVDMELFYRLLSALRSDTILVLVGDDAQLPSVGPGNVLRELVASKVPHVRLTQIFRQSVKGEIVINSHKINRGEMPDLAGTRNKSEFRFVQIDEEERIASLIVDMSAKLKNRDANFQVLSPKYNGEVGVNNLNALLRDRLNPSGPREWVYESCHFRLGDRLMVIQNDYKKCIYNGDMGKLVGITDDELCVKVYGARPEDPAVLVPFSYSDAGEKLKLAYAVSIHKCQGNEFDTVILPMVRSQRGMLQRNLLYTAVTRARKRVWILGEEAAIRRAVENNIVIHRNTVFLDLIGVGMRHGR